MWTRENPVTMHDVITEPLEVGTFITSRHCLTVTAVQLDSSMLFLSLLSGYNTVMQKCADYNTAKD